MPSIRKRKDKWQVQIRIKDAPPLAKSFTLKQDAERWAREMEAQAQICERGAQTIIFDLHDCHIARHVN